MTATPYAKTPADLWPLLHWLFPKTYTSYWRFVSQYVRTRELKTAMRWVTLLEGPKNLSALAKELSPFFLKRKKGEVLDLPPLTETVVPVQFSPKQSNLYRKVARAAWVELSHGELTIPNVLARLTRLQQVACAPVLIGDDCPSAKEEWLADWVSDHPDESVIVVSRFRQEIARLAHAYPDYPIVVGGQSERERAAALAEFEKTGRMLATLDAICESLNLQRAANMVILDGHWSLIKDYQLKQRIHRVGQAHPCHIYILQGILDNGKPTVDALVRRAVTTHQSEAAILEGLVQNAAASLI